METGERGGMGHVLVFLGPSQSHINPLLQFAKRLAFKGIKATVAAAVFISKSMQAEVRSIKIETISDGYDEGGYDSANSAEEYNESFKVVGSRTLEELIQKYEGSDCPFTCLVYDSFFPWVLDVAKGFGLGAAPFFTQSCAVFSIYYHVRQCCPIIPSVTEDILMPGLPPLALSDFPSFIVDKGSYPYFVSMLFGQFSNLEKADWILINTFDKLEGEVLTSIIDLGRIKTIGPTVPSMYLDERIKGDNDYGFNIWKPNSDACMKWLDSRSTGSVVYVSFGSLAALGEEQMEELARGLVRSNTYFLWVVRASEKNKLPNKFLEETSEKGLVVTWCPQLEVLAHQAVGCFVTHCGWNSTLEALGLGVPLVGVPQWSDQPTNAKYIEDVWEVGIRAKVDEKGIVRKEEMELCIKELMEGQKGKIIRKNASRWRELAKEAIDAGGSSDGNIEEFVRELGCVKSP